MRVERDEQRGRYELRDGDAVVGVIEFSRDGEVVDLTHTEVDDAYGGRGLGRRLVEEAVEDLREQGAALRPSCGYVRKVIADDPDALALVPEADRARHEL